MTMIETYRTSLERDYIEVARAAGCASVEELFTDWRKIGSNLATAMKERGLPIVADPNDCGWFMPRILFSVVTMDRKTARFGLSNEEYNAMLLKIATDRELQAALRVLLTAFAGCDASETSQAVLDLCRL